MKTLLICLALIAWTAPLSARADAATEAEVTRIEAERSQADARFATQEVACYRKFAVNDCLKAARAERRERLADLRRQEISLNDAERKRRAGERVRSIEEKNSAHQQEESAAQRAEASARQHDKQADIAERAAQRAQPQASAPARAARPPGEARERKAATRAAKEQRVHDAAGELRRYQDRQLAAQERQERVAKRLAESRKPAVKPLPVPP